MDRNGIIFVRLKDSAVDGQSEFFFSTLGAVYDKLNYRLLGVRQATLRQYLWQGGGRYENACCEVLKEYKVLDRAVQGIRRHESVKRKKRYKEPEVCRSYPKGQKARIYLPILEWTDAEVAEFITERGIKCHPLYYDEQGNFHVERRLGCIGCPLRSDKGKADFVKYPKFLKRLIASMQEWLDTHPNVKSHEKYGNAYNQMFHNLFANSYAEYQNLVTGGMFPEIAIDPKIFLEDYFKIDLTI